MERRSFDSAGVVDISRWSSEAGPPVEDLDPAGVVDNSRWSSVARPPERDRREAEIPDPEGVAETGSLTGGCRHATMPVPESSWLTDAGRRVAG